MILTHGQVFPARETLRDSWSSRGNFWKKWQKWATPIFTIDYPIKNHNSQNLDDCPPYFEHLLDVATDASLWGSLPYCDRIHLSHCREWNPPDQVIKDTCGKP